ncbi:MAG: IS1 family transposase [Sulfurimonas sp.]|uniref:IS1 family transposase n=1 Tax=Sulfurimonas sp. TaxID=2022749 RepID=UPI00262E6922|nr:IS1 family transposase [Sulfurimonas sp.]MDD5372478.1 IS1 family transposase [Sulfurimonas sp.]
MSETKSFYQESVEKLKSSLRFSHSIMDELFTFVGNKQNRYYVWTAMVYTQTGKPFYYYRLCPRRTTEELFEFDLDLPRVDYVFCDEAFTYDKMYADKAIQAKGAMTNIIENLNSQLRDKIAYLVRRTKAHAKSADWLDYKLARFFNNKNLYG